MPILFKQVLYPGDLNLSDFRGTFMPLHRRSRYTRGSIQNRKVFACLRDGMPHERSPMQAQDGCFNYTRPHKFRCLDRGVERFWLAFGLMAGAFSKVTLPH